MANAENPTKAPNLDQDNPATTGPTSQSANLNTHWEERHIDTSADQSPTMLAPLATMVQELITKERFAECLSSSGLMSIAELKAFEDSLTAEEAAADAESLCQALIKRKKLTPYQAQLLRQGQTDGFVFGNYTVVDKLGQGGMGVVYKAQHRRMKRTVALKVLPQTVAGSPDALQRFHREVEAAAKLTHPNIAAAYDADEYRGTHFLVMEYVDGPNLAQYVKQSGALPAGLAVNYIYQSARGLDHAHRQGVVHRDIKPGNLLVDRTGTLKILDMGLARFNNAATEDDPQVTDLTLSGRVMGTVDYMAPEQALDAKRADHRADIYSLGCTLFYLCAGKPMSPEGTLTQKLLWHQNQPVPSLTEACPTATPDLNAVFQRMVAKQPEERQQSMTEVMSDLEACMQDLSAVGAAAPLPGMPVPDSLNAASLDLTRRPDGTLATRTQTGLKSAGNGKRRNRVLLALGAAGAAAIVALLGVLMQNQSQSQAEVLVQISEPGAQIYLDGAPLAANGNGDDRQRALKIDPGKPTRLRVVKSGFEPFEQHIKADDAQPIQVALLPSKSALIAAGGANERPPIDVPKPAPVDPFLQWVLTSGGTVTLIIGQGNATTEISRLEDVPPPPFVVKSVKLDSANVNDADLAMLKDRPQLTELSLKGSPIGDSGLRHIAGMGQLWSLDLSSTKVTDSGLASLKDLSELRDLNLQRTAVSDVGLARLAALSKLEQLYLSDTRVTDTGLKHLQSLVNLREVSLNGNPTLTTVAVNGLKAALPQLRVAWDEPEIDREVARSLLPKGARVALVTSNNKSLNVERIADLPGERFQLHVIDLSGKPGVTDVELGLLVGLTELRTLNLDGTGVSSDGLDRLKDFKSLKLVDLGSLQLTDASVEILKMALPGAEIRWNPGNERRTAEWVIEQKGTVSVSSPDGDQFHDINDVSRLPAGRFDVRQVNLENCANVGDADLARFRKLAQLETLYLHGTSVTDAGIKDLIGCERLRDLGLNKTKIGDPAMATIGRLNTLRGLYLAETAATDRGIEHLKTLPQLTHLSLAKTDVTDKGLLSITRLGNIVWLTVSGTPITDGSLAHLTKLTNLKELWVDGTHLTDAGQEELAAALPKCKIEGNPPNPQRAAARWVLQQGGVVETDAGTLRKLSELPRAGCIIRKIDLAQSPKVTSAGLAAIVPCTQLETIDLSKTTINDAGLAHLAGLPELTEIGLAETRVTDDGLLQLKDLRKLKSLDLRGVRIAGTNIEQLREWTNLGTLLLGNARLTDRSLALIAAAYPNLTDLDLSYNTRITDKGIAQLAGLAKLQRLELAGTKVSDAVMRQVGSYPDLQTLDLTSTTVSDAGVANLKGLRELRTLKLYGTPITDSSLSVLAELKKLRNLDVSRTKVTDGAAKNLQTAIPGLRIAKSADRQSERQGQGGEQGYGGQDQNAPQQSRQGLFRE